MSNALIEMKSHDDQVLFDALEARGEEDVRATLFNEEWGADMPKVAQWIDRKEQARGREAVERARRNTDAAESAATAASNPPSTPAVRS